jgi:hypothetical protein
MAGMRAISNCPAVPGYDPTSPISHAKPVHHIGLIRDWHPACVWAQLDWERERGDGGPQYRENLEARWQELNLCSGCLRELDHPFMTEMDALRRRAENAESKLNGIEQSLRLPDSGFRMAVLEILEREEEPGEPE